MTAAEPRWPDWSRLRQPDPFTCGPSSVVLARWVLAARRDPATPSPEDGFAGRVLTVHRRERGWWPRWLGMPPWAVARALAREPGGAWSWWRGVRAVRRGSVHDDVLRAAGAGVPVPVFIGDRRTPRHVVLVVGTPGDDWAVYDPARGELGALTRAQVEQRNLPLGRWTRVWFPVLPQGPAMPRDGLRA
ncbi:hypothetical protein [Nocardioides sp. GY 10127]|uniref:hypothetical protein n=1 Tax=Nocardioides sp. GY 10127 TaxID=2569762 RepID=UPI0010A7F781|nr:hypothetical protein [Nocardioides sp. GY 10127]TIC84284.1 hypothetical protein E8D37_05770 [Nocardioides sp. GY 10127]